MSDQRRTLSDFLGSKALARLVTHFLVHPDEALHLRALQRHTDLGMRSLRRELAKLVAHGLLVGKREDDGRLIHRPKLEHEGWRALEAMVRAFGSPEEIMEDALADLAPRIRAGFIYGSTARGDVRPDSDLDLFLVAEGLERSELSGELMDAGMVLGREVNVRMQGPDEYRARRRASSPFLRDVLDGPKLWVVGSEEELEALV